MGVYVIGYDVGTTGLKTCLFEIDEKIRMAGSAMEGYGINILPNGGAEQDPEDWWRAMCNTTREVLQNTAIKAGDIKGVSFCSQAQGVVLVDKEGKPVRPAMSYMDARAVEELKKDMGSGIRVMDMNVMKLVKSLKYTGVVAGSVKDPVFKYKWEENNEPEVFKRIYKWLDVKEYLLCKCTGKFVITEDDAFGMMIYDTRKGKEGFSSEMCRIHGVNINHLPQVIGSKDIVGGLKKEAAELLGLMEGTPVVGGGNDACLIGIGAGAVDVGSTHIYSGTSGWVSTVMDHQIADVSAMIGGVVAADKGRFNYFAEMETAGKCLEWVKDHLALDEIDIYLDKKNVCSTQEGIYTSLYDYMMEVIKEVPAGSNGVIFTPWLIGNRCPFEDVNARGMFFNISLDTGKTEMIHAVLEGICYHLRWQLESIEKKVKTSENIRFVGGGALSRITCQLLADILGRKIETIDNAQNAGAVGAAVLTAVGLGIFKDFNEAKSLISVKETFIPDMNNKKIHDRNYQVFKNLYKNNKKNFAMLNR